MMIFPPGSNPIHEMKRLEEKEKEVEEGGGFTRLASFVCECEPLSVSEEHLQAIEATFQSSHSQSPPRRRSLRRRLPTSLLALQLPTLSPSDSQGYSRMRLPVMKFSGKIMYSRSFDEVQKAVTKLLEIVEEKKKTMMQIAIGFDIEWRPSFRRGVPPGKVAVMQICGDTSHCHVLHLIHSGIPQNLQHLLEDPTVLKVGAGIAGDASKVFRDYNISVQGVEDLSFHANEKLGGGVLKWGLAAMTETVLSKQLEKPNKIRLGNWETPVLSEKQLEYAATDAFASWYLYQAIKDLPDAQKLTDSSGKDGSPNRRKIAKSQKSAVSPKAKSQNFVISPKAKNSSK